MSEKITFDFSSIEKEFKKIKVIKQKLANYEILNIENIPTVQDGLKLIERERFVSIISSCSKLIGLTLSINEGIKNESITNLRKFKSSFFVAIQSTLDKRESKTYWKVKENNNIYELFIDDDSSDNFTSFFHDFLAKEIKCGRTGKF